MNNKRKHYKSENEEERSRRKENCKQSERDLGLFGNGGDEIGEEIEAEEWLRRLLSCRGNYGLQLCYQDTELRKRQEVFSHVLLRH